jgi:hypothetical protein
MKAEASRLRHSVTAPSGTKTGWNTSIQNPTTQDLFTFRMTSKGKQRFSIDNWGDFRDAPILWRFRVRQKDNIRQRT